MDHGLEGLRMDCQPGQMRRQGGLRPDRGVELLQGQLEGTDMGVAGDDGLLRQHQGSHRDGGPGGAGRFGGKSRFHLPGAVGNTTSRFWDRGLVNGSSEKYS